MTLLAVIQDPCKQTPYVIGARSCLALCGLMFTQQGVHVLQLPNRGRRTLGRVSKVLGVLNEPSGTRWRAVAHLASLDRAIYQHVGFVGFDLLGALQFGETPRVLA